MGIQARLLAAFGRRFGVELAGFDQGLHFGPAGHLDQSADLQQRLSHPDRLRKRPLTVAHLVAAVQSGRLRNQRAVRSCSAMTSSRRACSCSCEITSCTSGPKW